MAQYEGRTVLPLETVCRDFFTHLKPDNLVRKVLAGELRLPLLRLDDGGKSARGVHLEDLAEYLEGRRLQAKREMLQCSGREGG